MHRQFVMHKNACTISPPTDGDCLCEGWLRARPAAVRKQAYVDALRLVSGPCEITGEEAGCLMEADRQPDAADRARRWCRSCTAWRALHGGLGMAYAGGRVIADGAVR